tara:strand:- start:18525 stop:18746 length:222 start_codon:yes stop_codon:yes gene_type:complete
MKFLIYQSKEEADEKADQEGQALNLPFWQDPTNVTRTLTAPIYTLDEEWALDVTDYTTLTQQEEERTVEEINL